MSDIIANFLFIEQQVRLYHWSTLSYAKHKASCELYKSLGDFIDTFIETVQGKMGGRISYKKIDVTLFHVDDQRMKIILKEFKHFLVEDLQSLVEEIVGDAPFPDLTNQRDDILGKIEQTLYLFSLS